MATAGAQSPGGIMAIRFFQAIFEASTFVGTHYILGSWYTERELGKRSGIFTASGLAGTMIGGFIQTGINSSMNGLHGISGVRVLARNLSIALTQPSGAGSSSSTESSHFL